MNACIPPHPNKFNILLKYDHLKHETYFGEHRLFSYVFFFYFFLVQVVVSWYFPHRPASK